MKIGDRRDRGWPNVSGMSWLGLKNRRSENGCMDGLLIKIRWNPSSKLVMRARGRQVEKSAQNRWHKQITIRQDVPEGDHSADRT